MITDSFDDKSPAKINFQKNENTVQVETVCCLYHQKRDFISVPYEPKDPGYLKKQK